MPKNKYSVDRDEKRYPGPDGTKLNLAEYKKHSKELEKKFSAQRDKRFEDAYKRKALKPPTLKEKREAYRKKVEKRRSEMVASRKKKRKGGSISYSSGQSASQAVKGFSKNFPGMGD